MVTIPVQCPHCHSTEVIKAGKQATGAQRYQCQNGQCARRIFLLQYQDRGRVPEVRRQVVDMALNGSGVRDTARVLRISPTTVIAVLKKSRRAATRQPRVAATPSFTRRPVRGRPQRAAELDEMWSFVGAKATARWLWHALDHHTGRVLAYVVGTRKDAVFLKLQRLARPLWHHPVLHGQGGCLSAASSARAAHGRKADDAEDRTQASHVAHAPQTLSPQDAVFFPLVPHARPPHWVIYEPR